MAASSPARIVADPNGPLMLAPAGTVNAATYNEYARQVTAAGGKGKGESKSSGKGKGEGEVSKGTGKGKGIGSGGQGAGKGVGYGEGENIEGTGSVAASPPSPPPTTLAITSTPLEFPPHELPSPCEEPPKKATRTSEVASMDEWLDNANQRLQVLAGFTDTGASSSNFADAAAQDEASQQVTALPQLSLLHAEPVIPPSPSRTPISSIPADNVAAQLQSFADSIKQEVANSIASLGVSLSQQMFEQGLQMQQQLKQVQDAQVSLNSAHVQLKSEVSASAADNSSKIEHICGRLTALEQQINNNRYSAPAQSDNPSWHKQV